jgi:predicted GIY-YIG superfamily endonuclease
MLISKQNDKIKSNYIGYTTNPYKRIRQHNQFIKGGAKMTKKYPVWEFLFIIEGFKTKSEAMSCEWKLKHPNNKNHSNIKQRLNAINELFTIDNKFTTKCNPINKKDNYFIYMNSNHDIINDIYLNNILCVMKINLSNDLLLKNIF